MKHRVFVVIITLERPRIQMMDSREKGKTA
jgi:hypothetical protein